MEPMDVDSPRQVSDDSSDSDIESELSLEEESDLSLPTRIYDLVLPAVKTLLDLVKSFPNIPHEQQKAWATSAARVAASSVPSYKFALIGKTGSGKSTLINCLLGSPILPSSASGYAVIAQCFFLIPF
ncbi:hypothetical protein B0H11DRAFT_2060151 [Mycena galericulata]|nr:hypothetical protein B0H11DRAFT_2060151 [Mycena galericulata]